MSPNPIRVLVVDDSAVMRALLSDRIESAPGLTVADKARDGADAIAKAAALRPDVITLDLQMPGMDGLAVLDALLRIAPFPIVMVSALTRSGAAVTLESLERGAVDYVAKPARGGQEEFAEELIQKIRAAAEVDVRRMLATRRRRAALGKPNERKTSATVEETSGDELEDKCVAIGVSTGGPPALARLLADMRPPMPPIVVVQHMPEMFTGPLAARLDALSPLSVREAAHGDVLRPNGVWIAPGGRHLEIVRRGGMAKVLLRDGDPVSGHKPSVDVMMAGAAKTFGPNCLGVIMTGMGRDGAAGCRAIRQAGGFVLGQDEATSDVYGMNKVAFVEGNVDRQFALGEAAAVIARHARRLGLVEATA